MEAIPLTTNGKTDKKALAVRLTKATEASALPEPLAPDPPTPIEQLLRETFAAVFGATIDIQEDYWVLAIDSIRAVQISARLRNKGYKVMIRHILQARTIAELARQVTLISAGQPIAVAVGAPRLSNHELNSLFD